MWSFFQMKDMLRDIHVVILLAEGYVKCTNVVNLVAEGYVKKYS
jgi:hypothetical protein